MHIPLAEVFAQVLVTFATGSPGQDGESTGSAEYSRPGSLSRSRPLESQAIVGGYPKGQELCGRCARPLTH